MAVALGIVGFVGGKAWQAVGGVLVGGAGRTLAGPGPSRGAGLAIVRPYLFYSPPPGLRLGPLIGTDGRARKRRPHPGERRP